MGECGVKVRAKARADKAGRIFVGCLVAGSIALGVGVLACIWAIKFAYLDGFFSTRLSSRSTISPQVAVHGISDADGDGLRDIVVGVWTADPVSLRVTRIGGKSGMRLPGEFEWTRSRYMWVHCAVPDSDGDHQDDLVASDGEDLALVSGASGERIRTLLKLGGSGVVHVDSIGDVDGDQSLDFALSRVGSHVQLVNASTGREIGAIRPAEACVDFGYDLAHLRVDSDECEDLIIGVPANGGCTPENRGYVEVRSGRAGRLLYTVRSDPADDYFGQTVVAIPDFDRDGREDFMVNTLEGARIFSGCDGTPLLKVAWKGERWGGSMPLADMDHDGVPEYFCLEDEHDPTVAGELQLTIRSGLDGSLLRRFGWECATTPAHQDPYYHVDAIGDVSGDGVFDFFFCMLYTDALGGGILNPVILSGEDGRVLTTCDGLRQ